MNLDQETADKLKLGSIPFLFLFIIDFIYLVYKIYLKNIGELAFSNDAVMGHLFTVIILLGLFLSLYHAPWFFEELRKNL